MSSARPSGRNTGSEPSLLHLYDRMNQLDSRVSELRSTVLTKDGYADRRNHEDGHIRREFQTHRAISHRTDLNVVELRSDVAQMKSRMDSMDSRMRHSDRVRFNSLAHTTLAPISPVPVFTDGSALEWPKYFPRTVWKFWCLKKKSRGMR